MRDVSLPQYLNRELKGRGWSGRKLALRAGIGTTTVSLMLRGERTPEPDTLHKVAEALDVDQRLLLRLAGHLDVKPVSEIDPEALYLAQRLTALPRQQRTLAFNAVSNMVDALSIGYAHA